MITFSFKKLPVDADGKAYDSLEDFQAAELAKVLPEPCADSDVDSINAICACIVEHKDAVIEILELTMDARPAARGKKKPRKPKTVPVADTQPEIGQA